MQSKEHDWILIGFSYASWVECTCGYKPANQMELDEHETIVAGLQHISERTGLSVEACRNMLEAGWAYVEELNQLPKWEKPHPLSGVTRVG